LFNRKLFIYLVDARVDFSRSNIHARFSHNNNAKEKKNMFANVVLYQHGQLFFRVVPTRCKLMFFKTPNNESRPFKRALCAKYVSHS